MIAAAANPIRVCYMIDRLARAGTESQLLALIRHLDRSQVSPVLCLLDGRDLESRELEPADCEVWRLGVVSFRQWNTWRRIWELVRRLRGARIDVLQLYFPESTYVGAVAGRLAGVPRILRTQNNLGYWMGPVDRTLARVCDRLLDGTVANCPPCRDAAVERGGSRRGSVVVVENGVDVDRFAAAAARHAPGPRRRVGMVANLRPVKNPGLFVAAAKRIAAEFADVDFVLAGDGELRAELECAIAAANMTKRVRLTGSLADVGEFVGGLDVAVLCSHSEGLSNVILEYLAAGKPVVATNVGAASELIASGVDGVLVPSDDAAALAEGIRGLLTDPERARQMGRLGQEKVRRRFCHHARARRFAELYAAVLGSDRGDAARLSIAMEAAP